MKVKSRLLIFVTLVCVLFSLTLSVAAAGLYDMVAEPQMGAQYYMVASVEGVDYFFRHTKSGESVTHTAPYSLCTTTDPEDKEIKLLTLAEVSGGFTLDYPDGSKRIYSYDVDNDGVVDCGVNGKATPANHYFYWDAENQYISQTKNGEQYVMVLKKLLSSGSGMEEYRMLTVPVSEVDPAKGVYPVRLAQQHSCSFSQEWTSNEYSHWHACSCGEKKNLQLHQVAEWTVITEPAVGTEGSRKGLCGICGAEVTEVMDALAEQTQPSESVQPEQPGESTPEEKPVQPSDGISPVGLVCVVALAVTGLAIMIWGKKKDKA